MPPIIIPASSTSGTGPTLFQIRQRLADELGIYHLTTVSDTGDNADTARVVIADEFRDDEAGYDWMGQGWLYAKNGDQAGIQRRIISQPDAGYQGNLGAVLLARPFSSALEVGDIVEITSPLPVKRHLAIKGLNDLINEALARIWVEVRLAITGNGTSSYSLTSYSWLKRYDQTRGIYDDLWMDPANEPELSPYPYRFVTTGAGVTLVTGRTYTSADTFYLAAIVRADRYVSDGTTWGFTASPGLLGDAYQCACPEEWAVTFAMVKALQHMTKLLMLNKRLSKDERTMAYADLMQRRQQWAAAARSIKENEFPDPVAEPTESMIVAQPEPYWN